MEGEFDTIFVGQVPSVGTSHKELNKPRKERKVVWAGGYSSVGETPLTNTQESGTRQQLLVAGKQLCLCRTVVFVKKAFWC